MDGGYFIKTWPNIFDIFSSLSFLFFFFFSLFSFLIFLGLGEEGRGEEGRGAEPPLGDDKLVGEEDLGEIEDCLPQEQEEQEEQEEQGVRLLVDGFGDGGFEEDGLVENRYNGPSEEKGKEEEEEEEEGEEREEAGRGWKNASTGVRERFFPFFLKLLNFLKGEGVVEEEEEGPIVTDGPIVEYSNSDCSEGGETSSLNFVVVDVALAVVVVVGVVVVGVVALVMEEKCDPFVVSNVK